MLTQGLYQAVLVEPALLGANELRILTGYASAQFAEQHSDELTQRGLSVRVSVLIGMSGESGVDEREHHAWIELANSADRGGRVEARYLRSGVSDHSKTYVWLQDGTPVAAWTGSANYSASGFGRGGLVRGETLTPVSATEGVSQVESAIALSIGVTDPDVYRAVEIYRIAEIESRERVEEPAGPSVRLPLVLARSGEVHNAGAGLNWGHRGTRQRDEAYIPVPQDVARSDFFPTPGEPFTVLTDDGAEITMVRAQAGGKALHSSPDNSTVGAYFRERLGLLPGAFVTTVDLNRYGSISVEFVKVDDRNYVMNFPSGHDSQ